MPVPVIFMLCVFCMRVLDDNRDNQNSGMTLSFLHTEIPHGFMSAVGDFPFMYVIHSCGDFSSGTPVLPERVL